eukprot:gene561-706_t
MKLTEEQLAKYKRDGYLIIPNFVTSEEIESVTSEMKKLVHDFDPTEAKTIFTTKEQERVTNSYFIGSSSTIRFFFEEGALKDGEIVVPKDIAFNKVGHALHDLNPAFEKFSYSQKIKDLIYSLGYNKALSVQSMYIFKNPKIGGEVGIHQDSTFLHTTPLTTHALWFALEDAKISNGCLRALPGSHIGGIKRRFIMTKDENKHCKFIPEDAKEGPFDIKEFVALECPKGSVILLDGAVQHYSEPNTSPESRHAYTLHFIEGDGTAVYEPDNWLQRPESFPFRVL